jgi:ATP-dependent DNA helicase PIF1
MTDISHMEYGVVTGAAGSGKTHLVRHMIADNPSFGLLCATTGVAARVLGDTVPTLHAACGFYDIESLRRNYRDGTLLRNLKTLKKDYDRIIIDEASMLDAETLTLLTDAALKAGIGLILVGDWMQLPPITDMNQKPNWAFHSPMWSVFENIVRLETQYRQTNQTFLRGLNALRCGDGKSAIPLLKKAGVTMSPIPSGDVDQFDGLTLVATNNSKRAIDSKRYDVIDSPEWSYPSTQWGHQSPEWKDIPKIVTVKEGARVMLLRNKYENGALLYANGETGTVTSCHAGGVYVARDSGSEVFIEPAEVDDAHRRVLVGDTRQTHITKKATGGIRYLPITKAWALTVHKAQGLTMDVPVRVKLWADAFWKTPAMVYVAASRVKKPGLLDIAGGDTVFDKNSILTDKCVAAKECQVLEAA